MAIIITTATRDDIPEIVNFTALARANNFPMLAPVSKQRLATELQNSCLEHPDGALLIARTGKHLLATIAYVPFDHRFEFPEHPLGQGRVVEVVRLHVDPAYRRVRLGSKMFTALEEQAHQAGIQTLYLHTHPILPGARVFWEKQGFLELRSDPDALLEQTIHMSRCLEQEA